MLFSAILLYQDIPSVLFSNSLLGRHIYWRSKPVGFTENGMCITISLESRIVAGQYLCFRFWTMADFFSFSCLLYKYTQLGDEENGICKRPNIRERKIMVLIL